MKTRKRELLLIAIFLFFASTGTMVHAKEKTDIQDTKINTIVTNARSINPSISVSDIDASLICCPEEKIVVTRKPKKNAQFPASYSHTSYTSRSSTSDFITDCSTNYGFQMLKNSEYAVYLQELYVQMLEQLTDFYGSTTDSGTVLIDDTMEYYIGTIDCSQSVLTMEEIYTVFQSVVFDHPIFYCVKNKVCSNGKQIYLLTDEAFSRGSVRASYSQKIQTMIESFGSRSYSSNYEAAKYVHDTIIATADYAFLEDGISPKDNIFVHSIAGYVSDDKEIVCDGYAKTFAAIMNYLDIETILVTGYGVAQDSDKYEEKDAHAWNLIALGNGKYYFVDVTWDDNEAQGAADTYLCIGSELYRTHKIIPTEIGVEKDYLYPLPECASVKFTGTDSRKTIDNPVYEVTAREPADTTGDPCGDKVYAKLDADGVLTISGEGEMWDFGDNSNYTCPWAKQKEKIKKVIIKNGVTSIGEVAFENCLNLKTVTFGNTLLKINGYAFYGCKNLEDFELPARLTTIWDGAFGGSEKLEDVSIPDRVTFLGARIFQDNPNLKHIYLGGNKNVPSYSYGMPLLRNCPSLEAIDVSPDNIALFSSDGVLYTTNDSTFSTSDDQLLPSGSRCLIQYPCGKKDKTYTLLPETAIIREEAITYTQYLETIVFPERLTEIETGSISFCPSLKSLTFPKNVRIFWFGIGQECENLEYMENLSETEISVNSWASQYKEPIDGRWYYKMWADATTKKVVPKITKGMKVIPVFFGKTLNTDDTFIKDGITYRVVKSNLDVFRPPLPSEVAEGFINGSICVEKAENPDLLESLPDKIEYEGWIYDLASKAHVHKPTYIPEVSSTCYEKGVIPHYECTCGKCFRDEDCQNEITKESTLLDYQHIGGITTCLGTICDLCGKIYGNADVNMHLKVVSSDL